MIKQVQIARNLRGTERERKTSRGGLTKDKISLSPLLMLSGLISGCSELEPNVSRVHIISACYANEYSTLEVIESRVIVISGRRIPVQVSTTRIGTVLKPPENTEFMYQGSNIATVFDDSWRAITFSKDYSTIYLPVSGSSEDIVLTKTLCAVDGA